ncbi:MAG: acetyl-CoA C-acyltransferase [Bacteroidales bacterium]|nr:acetyl-CoA C-acyltransferase [Bacteroidales bacterium]
MAKKEVFIVSAVRTPIGSFLGGLSGLSATKLGSIVIKTAIEKAGIQPDNVDEVFMGNVLSAGLGQAPARQAALFAGLPNSVPCTTVNKVCASGMKSVMIGSQSILAGDNSIVVCGGMESMSNVPFYVEKYRTGNKLGHSKLIDGMINDGLWDVYNDYHMGNAAELCASEMKISREEQDAFTIRSYRRSGEATDKGLFKDEIVPVEIPQRRGDPIVIDKDEEYTRTNFDKVPSLRPVFQKDGTVTAANASTINDGASAVVLVSGDKLNELGLKPLARLVAYADAAQAPEWFTTTPVKAVKKVLKLSGLSIEDIDYFEINEAFAVVVIAALKELNIDIDKTNVNGGGVSLGHPIGASGNRIIVTLANVLKQNKGKYGLATLCNGGGGASAIIIENLM